MTTFRFTLELHTAFGTPLSGDTLFGQLCWTAREHLGKAELEKLLAGYTDGRPWLVVSDGFPSGFLPKPAIPASLVGGNSVNMARQRKAEKARHWIPLAEIGKPLPLMLAAAVNDSEAYGNSGKPVEAPQSHNTLNRLTGTTGEEGFAPYTQPQIFFARGQLIDIHVVLDEARMSLETLQTLLQAVGSHGFGRDASIGLGKFTVKNVAGANVVGANLFARSNEFEPTGEFEPTAYLTLAPCAPQNQGFDGDRSYWRVITRFGRHGNLHGISEKPFKNPVLLAATGAVFVPQAVFTHRHFIGKGLGGNGSLSKVEPDTVQQGYAPVICIRMEV